jgi:hypothetical protein
MIIIGFPMDQKALEAVRAWVLGRCAPAAASGQSTESAPSAEGVEDVHSEVAAESVSLPRAA